MVPLLILLLTYANGVTLIIQGNGWEPTRGAIAWPLRSSEPNVLDFFNSIF